LQFRVCSFKLPQKAAVIDETPPKLEILKALLESTMKIFSLSAPASHKAVVKCDRVNQNDAGRPSILRSRDTFQQIFMDSETVVAEMSYSGPAL
jgi:hypothetical protein